MEKGAKSICRMILLILLVAFSVTAIIFSLVVLFTDLGRYSTVHPAQMRGMFTVFANQYISEVHPQQPTPGRAWSVSGIQFTNDNLAVVEATDGVKRTKLEFIFLIEGPNVRVMKVNDVTKRDQQDAQLALIRFLDFLRVQNYVETAKLYGGSLSRLAPYGDVHVSIPDALKGYCSQVSPIGSCMLFRITQPVQDPITGAYQFTVNFLRDDGSVLELETGKKDFNAIVEPRDGSFVVLTLPFD